MGTSREKLCARLRVLRAERGLSQENLADLIGMSLPGYAKIERGLSDITLDRLDALAGALNTSVADLLDVEDGNMYVSHSHAQVIAHKATADSSILGSLLEKMIEQVRVLERELAAEKAKRGLS